MKNSLFINELLYRKSKFITISFIATTFCIYNFNLSNCQELDPGQMFGGSSDSDSDIYSEQQSQQDQSIQSMLYNWSPMTDKTAWFTDDSSCSTGISIVLKRIVWKLYNHVNKLQPNELDDEFIYQSTISYQDYSSMMKYLHENQLNCATLHRLDSLLSRFISKAEVTRPSQNDFFSNLFANPFNIKDLHTNSSLLLRTLQSWPHLYLATILLSVGFTTWFLRHVAGYGEWKSNLFGILIPGFIQFYMHQHWLSINNHQERIERCENPSYLNRILYYLNYDYNNCYGLNSNSQILAPHLLVSNVAKVYIQYLSELIFEPIITFATKIGQASQSYLSSYSGLNKFTFGPLFLIIIYICILIFSIYLAKYIITSIFSSSRPSRANQRSINYNSNNNRNQMTASQKRKQIDYGNSSNNNHQKKNKK